MSVTQHRLNFVMEANKLVAICSKQDWKRYLEKSLPGNKVQVEHIDLTIHYFQIHKLEVIENERLSGECVER